MLQQLLMNRFPVQVAGGSRTACTATGWVPKQLAFQFRLPGHRGDGATDFGGDVLVPIVVDQPGAIHNCARSGAVHNPNSNRNRRTSLVFRMDFLLAGTLISLFMSFNAG